MPAAAASHAMRAIALPHAHSAHPARARPAAAAKGVPAIQTSQITSSYAGARLAAGRRGGSARTLAGFAVRAKAAGDDEDSCAFGAFSGFKLLGVPHMTDSFPDMETFPNPLAENDAFKGVRQYFIDGGSVVLKDIVANINEPSEPTMFLRAGPKKDIFYNPDETRAAIVTCGGLCPGLNTVVREIVCTLWFQYGVRDILGVEGGYKGFYSSNMKQLDPKVVDAIHKQGGTFLGTSRGGSDIGKICDAIVARGINQVYIIGGDGTMRGAHAIHQELSARKAEVAVIGVPKTIDNDIDLIDKSFGFDTAVEEAQRAINAAHVEATSTENGIGIVKLMGRHAGFIAMYATLASRDVDLCLIPEVPFFMEGRSGLVEFVCKRLRRDGHIVIVVAEGAGQHYVSEFSHLKGGADASGNKLLADIGLWLKDQVKTEPSNGSDNVYCNLLSQSAVHGAMAGYTGFMAGPINGRHALIPMDNVVTRTVNIYDRMWARLLASTGQPAFSAQQLLQARAAGGSVDSNDMATEGARRPAANPAAMAGGRGAVHDPEVQKAIPEDLKKPDSTPHDEAEKAKGGAKTGTA